MFAFPHRPSRRAPCALLFVLVVLLPIAQALPPDVPPHQLLQQRWGVTDGLPQTTVTDIAQGADGYLWLATQDGLARFDGQRFTGYRSIDDPGLGDDFRTAITVDRDGVVWSGSAQGLNRFDGRHWQPVAGIHGAVQRLLPAADGGVWVATSAGLFRAELPATVQPVGSAGPTVALAHTRDNRLVVATADRLIVDPAGAAREIALPGFDALHSVVAAPAGSDVWLWVGGRRGLLGIDADGRIVRRPLKNHDVEALRVDTAGTLWIGSRDGLWRMPAGELPQPVQIDALGAGNLIRALFEDREGNLWVGSHAGGLFRLRGDPLRRIGAVDGLTDRAVWSLYADPAGGLWAGTDNGAWHGGLQGFRQPFTSTALPDPMVLAFLRSRDGTLWIGTRGGLARVPPGAAVPEPVAGVDAMIQALIEDDRGRLWIGSRAGVQRIVDGALETLGPGNGLPTGPIRDIAQLSDGAIWLAGDAGAWHEIAPDRFAALTDGNGVADIHVKMIRETRPGEVLLAIRGGIVRTTLAGESITRIDERAGLHAGMVMMLQAHGDDLWYATHAGIGRLPFVQLDQWLGGSRTRLQPQVFGALDDALPAQCNGGHRNAGVLVDGRWLWCPSLRGALALDLDASNAQAAAPQPLIEAVRADGVAQPLAGGVLTLPLGARDIEFDYAGLLLGDPSAVEHRVQLVGYDREPRAVGGRRTITYTNLPPRAYTFRVSARVGAHGPPQTATLALQVPAHMYESRWFQALLLAALAAAVLGAIRWHRLQFVRQRRLLAEQVRNRTAALEDANRRLRETSVTDPLTGLHNRRYLHGEMIQDVAQVDRTYTTGRKDCNRDLLFLLIDLDNFKRINDRYGHRTGDSVLTQFAALLQSQVRECDYIVRWGGEEFLIVGRQVDREHSGALAERITAAVRNHRFGTDHGELRCSCSIGVAVYPPLPSAPRALSWQETVELADAAMYFAKHDGRDRWVEIRLPGGTLDDDFMDRFRDCPRALADRGGIIVRTERSVDVAA